jgi:hypothetical protein
MKRRMPPIAARFRSRVAEAVKLAEIGEVAKQEASAGSQTRRNLHHARLELLYELAYLRIFISWESMLEECFLRYLCGYQSVVGVAVLPPGAAFQPTLGAAEAAVLGKSSFKLWHNPVHVVDRAQRFFSSSPIETVLLSNLSRLEELAAVRHRIAHSHADARQKFDSATISLAGRRYRGGRAGAFLRDTDVATLPPRRWVQQLGHELQGLAAQIS